MTWKPRHDSEIYSNDTFFWLFLTELPLDICKETLEHWNKEPGCLGQIGDEIPPANVGIIWDYYIHTMK